MTFLTFPERQALADARELRLARLIADAMHERDELVDALLLDSDAYICAYAEWILTGRPLSGQPLKPSTLSADGAKLLRELVMEQAAVATHLNGRDLHRADRRHE